MLTKFHTPEQINKKVRNQKRKEAIFEILFGFSFVAAIIVLIVYG